MKFVKLVKATEEQDAADLATQLALETVQTQKETKPKKEPLKIKFIEIDDYNKPIFKPLNKKYYLSDVNNLFNYGTDEKEIKKFYSEMPLPLNKYITFHGYSMEDDPMGSVMEEDLEIV